MIYEIREKSNRFNLFLSKKNGLKFKKSFSDRSGAEWFIADYLTLCCVICLEKGLVYKTRGTGGMYGGGNRRNNRYGRAPAGSVVACPECRAKHRVQYKNREVYGWVQNDEGQYVYMGTARVLILKPISD